MQTAKIIPINSANPALRLNGYQPDQAQEWIYPGKIIPVTPGISIGIAYDQVDGEYQLRFKFYHNAKRIKDITPDDRHQIDLRTSCRKIITILATRYNPNNGKPMKTLLVIEHVPYSWER